MVNNKPEQLIDLSLGLIYPPEEAIVPQLTTIRNIATSTIKMYEATKEIRTIQTNLNMIQDAINYLRGAPIPEDLKPLPEDTLKPDFLSLAKGFTTTYTLNKKGEYDVSVVGFNVVPKADPELFGEEHEDVSQLTLKIPVTCGKVYLVTQENPALELYKDDPSISFYEPDSVWVKEKEYLMEDDHLEYAFLIPEGRSNIKISVFADYEKPIIFNISAHTHYKEEEPLPQPEYKGAYIRSKYCKVKKFEYNDTNGTTYYEVLGTNLDPEKAKPNPEAYGNLGFDATEIIFHIPVVCFDTYKITQYNPILSNFSNESDVFEDPERGFYAQKEYMTTTSDEIDYSFIVGNGRSEIIIYLEDKKGTVWKYVINTHVHFKTN